VDPEGAVHSFAAHSVSISATTSKSSGRYIQFLYVKRWQQKPFMTVRLQIPKEHAQVAPFVVQMMALAPLLGWAQSDLGQDAFQQVLPCHSRP